MLNIIKHNLFITGLLISSAIFTGCGGSGSGDGSSRGGSSVDTYFDTLPDWETFAPAPLPEENAGAELVDETQTPTIEEITDPNGKLKVCTTEKVSFYNTPDEYVMFSPPTDVLYPGALIQGQSLRDGAGPGELLPLIVQQRNAVNVSIPDCTIPNNFRTVQPTLANVNNAVAEILFEAESLGQDCASPTGSLNVETFRNENQRALKAGMSGRYFGYSAKASGSYDKTQVENSVAVIFRESLYRVQIEAPQTPRQWFSEDFTQALLQQQVDLGRIGPDNIPAYVAEVTYGRIMTATMTSTHSEADMRFALEFKYSNPAGSVSGDAATRSQTIRDESSMTIAYLGGSAQATAAMLKSSDWTQYFGVPATASDAVPISFVIKSSSDNTPAVVQELTQYDRVTCYDKLADDATYAFQAEQQFTPAFSATGQAVSSGDINGDGNDDIIWSATAASARGEFAVAFANGDGTFQPLVNGEHIGANGLTGDFHMLITDVDNDGRDDIIFNILDAPAGSNNVFVAFYKASAGPGFIYSTGQNMSAGTGWNTFTPRIGQMDKLRGRDIVWNNWPVSTTTNRTYIAYAVDTTNPVFDITKDNLFALAGPFDHSANNFSGYEYVHLADFNGDGYDDIMWQNIDANGNSYYVALGKTTGLVFRNFHNFGGSWSQYIALAGDANGDGRADLIEPRQKNQFSGSDDTSTNDDFGIYIGQGKGVAAVAGTDVIGSHTYKHRDPVNDVAITDLLGVTSALQPDMYLADVNGDGSKDLIINDKGKGNNLTNSIGVGLSVVGGAEFTFARATQTLGISTDWLQYKTLIADINGDKRDDILWISNATTNSVYVGVAR